MAKLTPAKVAVTLNRDHGWDPDAAFSAATCWLFQRLPTEKEMMRHMVNMDRVTLATRPMLTNDQSNLIEKAYRLHKLGIKS